MVYRACAGRADLHADPDDADAGRIAALVRPDPAPGQVGGAGAVAALCAGDRLRLLCGALSVAVRAAAADGRHRVPPGPSWRGRFGNDPAHHRRPWEQTRSQPPLT